MGRKLDHLVARRIGLVMTAALPPLFLTGCAANLPKAEADAFKTIAAADRDALSDLTQAQLASRLRYAKRAIVNGDGRVLVSAGCPDGDQGDCMVTYRLSDKSDEVALVRSGANARVVMGSIARYGEQMAELAEAKDLDTVKAKAEAAGGAAKSLLLTVIPGADVAKPIIDLLLMAHNASLREKRRQALLANARAADPAIRQAALLLNGILIPVKTDLEMDAAREVNDIQARMADAHRAELEILNKRKRTADEDRRLAVLREGRARDLDLLVEASRKVNAVRGIDTDFGALATAHAKLIQKLENPDYNAEDVFRDLNQILVLIDQIKAAT